MLLRTSASFDSDDLEEVIRRWTAQAPAILVIEDLNWLLEKVNVSLFLNLLDGVDSKTGDGGLLLIATSNHPDQLDPAINNRPGRFDVVIEMPPPDRAMRSSFLHRKLAEIDAGAIEKVASQTEGLSFAHLQEILRLSGLTAIQGGRTRRTVEDVQSAASAVIGTHEQAVRGFPRTPEVPFGLLPLRDRRQQQSD
jgi:SpoVK/Ycf46/Vps4 family AAA+-type ATPase